ncbi:bacteriocin 51 precursor BacA [Paenilisteria newyorkensis]|uniref:bacteriocin 51 precursor BacA n=1 Tax=Listeria newyorkensis TaxID=1497681 RepID=UPI000740F539|nr:bacteriocin 51 precursor BacA [Listeria newyorkensis]
MKKILNLLIAFVLATTISISAIPLATDAASAGTKYTHNHVGYTCYKMSYYISPSQAKKVKAQTKKLNTISSITNFIGLSGFTAGVASLAFGSAVSANQVFVNAANKNKGVQVTYISHFSNYTTDSYMSNAKYVIK